MPHFLQVFSCWFCLWTFYGKCHNHCCRSLGFFILFCTSDFPAGFLLLVVVYILRFILCLLCQFHLLFLLYEVKITVVCWVLVFFPAFIRVLLSYSFFLIVSILKLRLVPICFVFVFVSRMDLDIRVLVTTCIFVSKGTVLLCHLSWTD